MLWFFILGFIGFGITKSIGSSSSKGEAMMSADTFDELVQALVHERLTPSVGKQIMSPCIFDELVKAILHDRSSSSIREALMSSPTNDGLVQGILDGDMTLFSVLILLLSYGWSSADYECLCSYNVETPVLDSPSNTSHMIGYMYEFDCKPVINVGGVNTIGARVIAFEQQPGYVKLDSQMQVQICPGDPSPNDLLTTTKIHTVTNPVVSSTNRASWPSSNVHMISTTSMGSSPITTRTQTTNQANSKRFSSHFVTSNVPNISTSMTKQKLSNVTAKPTNRPTTQTKRPATFSTVARSTSSLNTPSSLPTRQSSTIKVTMINGITGQSTTETTTNPSTPPTAHETTRKHFTTSTSDTHMTTVTTSQVNPLSIQPSTAALTSQSTAQATTSFPSTASSTTRTTRTSTTAVQTSKNSFAKGRTRGSPPTVPTSSSTAQQTQLGNTALCPSSLVQYAQMDNEILAQMGDSCFTVVPHQFSWSHAETYCNRGGGHLFHISDHSQNNFFYSLLTIRFNHSVWMGLHDTVYEEYFQWTSGIPVTYTNWTPGRKNNLYHHTVEDCGVFEPYLNHGQWDDFECGTTSPLFEDLEETHYFICQFRIRNAAQVTPTTLGSLNSCPTNVLNAVNREGGHILHFGKSCYERVPQRRTWNAADQDCRGKGGFLVQIGSSQEEAIIEQFLSQADFRHAVWIGLHDQGHEDTFTWTSGEHLSYTNWISGHRNNFLHHSLENCVLLVPYKYGQWDDVPCGNYYAPGPFGMELRTETYPYICEYHVVSSGSAILVGK